MTIRIVSIISRMNVGGPAVLLSELIENLPVEEFEHTLITGTCMSNETDYLKFHPLNSRVIYLENIQRALLPFNDFKSLLQLIRILRDLKPDVVHTHTSKGGVLGRLAAIIATPNARVIHTFHGHLLYGYFAPWKTKLVILLERVLAKITDNLVAVTSQVQRDLINAGIGINSNWSVIHPGIKIPVRKNRNQERQKLNLKDCGFIIVWIGRFTEIKNPLLAVKTIEYLPEKIKENVELIMIGDGELFDECKNYAKFNNLPIRFTGWLSEVGEIIDASDLLLMSSKNEGMPVVIIEAAIRGVPTLSTNVGGVSEFIKNNVTGFLSASDTSLTESLTEIILNSKRRKKVSREAESIIKSDFSIERYLENHLALYRIDNNTE